MFPVSLDTMRHQKMIHSECCVDRHNFFSSRCVFMPVPEKWEMAPGTHFTWCAGGESVWPIRLGSKILSQKYFSEANNLCFSIDTTKTVEMIPAD